MHNAAAYLPISTTQQEYNSNCSMPLALLAEESNKDLSQSSKTLDLFREEITLSSCIPATLTGYLYWKIK